MRKSRRRGRCGDKRADWAGRGTAPDAVKHGLFDTKLSDTHVCERVHLVQDDLGEMSETNVWRGNTSARNARHRGRVKEISCHEKPIV